ncbi:hypothetical protein Acr_01g0007280 [Actinidia rufa]|uniref:MAPK kinase substrate protein n=1 Tax=Actinidia rufa TaxID=165716 RepID=A0A7J0E4P7_9ERIC|nr:hypothetical protein Acr_01g0007280 [Actinidia rufa]
MDGLQRSVTSFRRQGSSGLVFDDKFLLGELNQVKPKDQRDEEKVGSREPRPSQTYRTVKDVSPAIDPPSPRVSGCGFCGAFGKSEKTRKPKSAKRRY